jgi:sarcosine oxidase subunit alpha
MTGPARIAAGLLTRAGTPLAFRFDRRALTGLDGDSLASALLANGIRLVGRSFKYHRPRGIVTAGAGEPCGLVDLSGPGGREPNVLATTLPLAAGLVAESQNRWPSLGFDLLSLNDRLARFLPAGFYYKTFMAPGWAWERVYEPLIRRAAGLGRLAPAAGGHGPHAEILHDHADVLVVGAGAAGLAAARELGLAGLRVVVAEEGVLAGGGTTLEPRFDAWRTSLVEALAALPKVRLLTRTTVLGAYGHGVFGALEHLSGAERVAHAGLRERLRVIRVRRLVLASGAAERLIAFPGNDVPGVMLAGAAHTYLRHHGVAVGRRPALFVNSDEAYAAAFALAAAGVRVAGVVDPRPGSLAADRARALGIEVHAGAVVAAVAGRCAVRGVRITELDGSRPRWLEADSLLVSGGYTPATALASQAGGGLLWQDAIAAFTPALDPRIGRAAGAVHGAVGVAAAARDGSAVGRSIAIELGAAPAGAPGPALPDDPPATALSPLWEVRGRGKAFVDLQNDVTADDVRLAEREGYAHVEHMKRYTTHGMATDQGRTGGLVGSAILAAARGLPVAAVGQARPRPYLEPVPFAALAGSDVGMHYRPTRRLALHDWHDAAGATFVPTGLWLRPLVYSRTSGWEPVLEEARAVRRSVGITDVSTLGKIDVQGPGAARFLDHVYANTFSTLAVGRARYGIMLREDGLLLDDGTTARLGSQHFIVTTTTANAAAVLEHLEFQLAANCAHLEVLLTDVGDHWAQFAVAGPDSRAVVQEVAGGLDLSNEAFPFMAAAGATIAGIPGRLFRISFSGELAYEIAVPATHALPVWQALLAAGRPFGIRPYGLDALNTLRIEKGHVTTAELNGNASADDLGFGRLLKPQGDFVGRTLAARPGLGGPERLRLVGLRPVDRRRRLRNGAQLVAAAAPRASVGYISSSTPAVALEGWVGLAMLADGRNRHGERLTAVSAVHGEETPVEVLSPHFYDPENARVRA